MKSWILAVLITVSAALGAVTLRAAAQSVMTGPRAAPAAPAGGATPTTPAPGAPPASAPATIHDDPTVAPDKGESADNNVSFPVDI